jgi:hypothetical protein
LVLCFATIAQANTHFSVVLHARTPGGTGTCTATGVPNCTNIRPTTQVAADTEFRLYIFINNYTALGAMQTAFAWPADWVCDPDGEPPITFGCRGTTQAYAHEPVNPGGPIDGTLATAFDCFTGPGLAAIGRIDFLSGAAGCLTQVNPAQGTRRVEVLDCQNNSTTIDADTSFGQLRLGAICVGTPGRDACDVHPAVEPATWGSIKATYRERGEL